MLVHQRVIIKKNRKTYRSPYSTVRYSSHAVCQFDHPPNVCSFGQSSFGPAASWMKEYISGLHIETWRHMKNPAVADVASAHFGQTGDYIMWGFSDSLLDVSGTIISLGGIPSLTHMVRPFVLCHTWRQWKVLASFNGNFRILKWRYCTI